MGAILYELLTGSFIYDYKHGVYNTTDKLKKWYAKKYASLWPKKLKNEFKKPSSMSDLDLEQNDPSKVLSNNCDVDAKKLIKALLKFDPHKRLQSSQIKQQNWFQFYDWPRAQEHAYSPFYSNDKFNHLNK